MSTPLDTITIKIGADNGKGEILTARCETIIPGNVSYADIVETFKDTEGMVQRMIPDAKKKPVFSRLLFPLGCSNASLAPFARINSQEELEHCKRMHARICCEKNIVIVAVFNDLL